MITKADLEAHVINTQMILRGVCSGEEVAERIKVIAHIEEMEGFHGYGNDKKRIDISKGVVKRRNAIYKLLIDKALGDDRLRLERYAYWCLQSDKLPDPNIIEIRLNI